MDKYIKIYGMPRTGTTFTELLIASNLKSTKVVTGLGSKHYIALEPHNIRAWLARYRVNAEIKEIALEAMSSNKVYPIIVIKNPYSWYQSITRFRYSASFDQSYSQYNKHYKVWKTFIEKPNKPFVKGLKIRYEDLLADPKKELLKICDHIGVELLNNVLVMPEDVPLSDKFTKERRKFYLSGGTFGLSNKKIKDITNRIDWKLMEFYGYKPVEV